MNPLLPGRPDNPALQAPLERFHPALLHSLLEAVKRFDNNLYSHICRNYQLDADRVSGLFAELEALGLGHVPEVLTDLRLHTRYDDMVYLAGRNAFIEFAAQNRLNARQLFGRRDLQQSLKQYLPQFTGQASYNHLQRGEVHFLELRNSLFTRNAHAEAPVCGFYCGLLKELAEHATGFPWAAVEQSCVACDPDHASCLIQFAPDR